MTLWDWITIAVAGALVVEGILKGAIRLACGLAGLLLGFLYAGRAVPFLISYMEAIPAHIRGPLAGIAGFVLILAGFVIAGIFLSKLIHAAGLGILNRLLGAVLGLAVAAYIAGGALGLARLYSSDLEEKLEASPVFSTLSGGALFLRYIVPPPESLLPDESPLIEPGLPGPNPPEEV